MDLALSVLSAQVGKALFSRGLRLVTAESCTGGWVAEVVTATAGSSDWFDRGFVTYSNAAKTEVLDVTSATLERHGAVSEATAGEMARGALRVSGADVALSVTGIAGPGGAVSGKPVGMVCFAWCAHGRIEAMQTRYFGGDREEVRRQAVVVALTGLLSYLET